MIGGESAWIINADTHRIYCSRDAKEVHGTWWFLPWHRAYLHATERNLQKALGDDRVALPYWHWSISPGIPALYKTGSLDHPRTGQDVAFPPYLLDLTGMAAPSYRGRVVNGQVIESAFGGHSGTRPDLRSSIEGTPHGSVHNAVGGDMMRLAVAARDPIFFAHHGNLDRLWEVWRTPNDGAHGTSEPWIVDGFAAAGAQDVVFEFLDVDSPSPYRVSVAQTRSTTDLGYVYAPAPTAPPAPEMIVLDGAAGGPSVGPDATMLSSQSKDYSVTPTGRRGPESFSPEGLAPEGRAILTLRGVEVPADAGANLAVYLSKGTAAFKPANAIYAGLIGVVATGSGPTKGNFALDVTEAIKKLKPTSEPIKVTVVPVRLSATAEEPPALQVEKIELSLP
jgi:polyphenol oxidase